MWWFLLCGSLAISSLSAISSTWQTAHSASLSVAFAYYAGSLRLDETWKYKFRLFFVLLNARLSRTRWTALLTAKSELRFISTYITEAWLRMYSMKRSPRASVCMSHPPTMASLRLRAPPKGASNPGGYKGGGRAGGWNRVGTPFGTGLEHSWKLGWKGVGSLILSPQETVAASTVAHLH